MNVDEGRSTDRSDRPFVDDDDCVRETLGLDLIDEGFTR